MTIAKITPSRYPSHLLFCASLYSLPSIRSTGTRASRRSSSTRMGSSRPVSVHDCVLPGSGLRVRIFYPCVSTAPSSGAPWFPASAVLFPNENAVALAEYLRLPAPQLVSPIVASVLHTTLPLACDAEPAEGPFPLTLFSHGLGGSIGGYPTFCATVAATGRIVVAPEHADGSAFAAYTGTERVRIAYKRAPAGTDEFPLRHAQLKQRVQELTAVLADVRAMGAGTAKQAALPGRWSSGTIVDFAGCVAAGTERIAVAGHSFGAGTALAFCFAARRGEIDAAVADVVCLDPWLYPLGRALVEDGEVGDARVLFVDQELSRMRDSLALRRMLRRAQGKGGFWSVKVLGGGHNNASDFATQLPRFIAAAVGLTPKVGDPDLFMKVQNDAVVSFVQRREWEKYWTNVQQDEVDGLAISVLPDAVVMQETT